MNGYYTRKRTNTAHGQLLHNSRYHPARSNTRPLQDPDTTRITTPLRIPSQVEQHAPLAQWPAEQTTRVLSSDRMAARGTNPLPSPASTLRDYAPLSRQKALPEILSSPSSDRNTVPENEHLTFKDHVVHLASGIWKLFKDTPPGPRFVCIFVSIGLLLLLSPVASALVQITAPVLGTVYIISGIIASFIIIHESLNNKNGSGTKPPDRHAE